MCLGIFGLFLFYFVSTSAFDCLERPEMTCHKSIGTLSTYSLADSWAGSYLPSRKG